MALSGPEVARRVGAFGAVRALENGRARRGGRDGLASGVGGSSAIEVWGTLSRRVNLIPGPVLAPRLKRIATWCRRCPPAAWMVRTGPSS